ncbi:hypothetical protein MHC_01120 [Mycoplasma haemocanis str. Illinois]|uniref:Uncharacterized protein n=1 Tax=Mycoplasma haemocanis (strain Illinois) TaxID=1111676 RepID=H6N618_MYCHN|nr:hypothetical protein [Mycoplasma haemocanis]AEW45090.1 hypothetical protein MHC_01120 [Mycoplasma haemocanis str. Illinois]
MVSFLRSRAKEVTIVSAGSAVVVGGFFLYKTFYKEPTFPIKELLAKKHPNKKWLSSSSDQSKRKEKWHNYKTRYKGRLHDPLSIPSNTLNDIANNISGSDTDAPNEFINKCDEISRVGVVNERDYKYQTALDFCTTE